MLKLVISNGQPSGQLCHKYYFGGDSAKTLRSRGVPHVYCKYSETKRHGCPKLSLRVHPVVHNILKRRKICVTWVWKYFYLHMWMTRTIELDIAPKNKRATIWRSLHDSESIEYRKFVRDVTRKFRTLLHSDTDYVVSNFGHKLNLRGTSSTYWLETNYRSGGFIIE